MLRVVWLLVWIAVCCGKERKIYFINKMSEAVEVIGIHNKLENAITYFKIEPEKKASIAVNQDFIGRFWAQTGSPGALCGEGMPCAPDGRLPMATVAEMRVRGSGDDYYVSLRFGFNLPMTITPTDEECPSAACANTDITRGCYFRRSTGCLSACVVVRSKGGESQSLNEDFSCCLGEYKDADMCGYTSHFREACPKAYYAPVFANETVFSCRDTDYTITFGYDS